MVQLITNNKLYLAVFFVTQYNSSLTSFVPNFRILTQVVAEKSLTEKKFTDKRINRQTNIITEKAKTTMLKIFKGTPTDFP